MSDIRKMTIVLGMVAAMSSFAAPAQAKNFLEEWFPFLFEEKESDAKPVEGETQAPFATDRAVDTTESKQLGIEYKPHVALESSAALDQPHRQPGQLLEWSSKTLSDSLDFDPLKYEEHLVGLNKFMTPYAIESLKAFMAKDNLLAALQTNNLVMRTFVTEPARLLNQGAVQGSYRWLIETPVTISFLPRGTSDYTGIQPKSQKINIRTQLGRVAQGGEDGVMIETLEFLPVPAAK